MREERLEWQPDGRRVRVAAAARGGRSGWGRLWGRARGADGDVTVEAEARVVAEQVKLVLDVLGEPRKGRRSAPGPGGAPSRLNAP